MLRARSAELMNGKVVFSTSRASNFVSSVLPSVSAVMPVPSETKKTDRCVMARSFRSFRRPRQHQGHDETAGGPLLYHWRPLRDLTALFNFRRSEEHASELQSLKRIPYAVFCLKKHQT